MFFLLVGKYWILHSENQIYWNAWAITAIPWLIKTIQTQILQLSNLADLHSYMQTKRYALWDFANIIPQIENVECSGTLGFRGGLSAPQRKNHTQMGHIYPSSLDRNIYGYCRRLVNALIGYRACFRLPILRSFLRPTLVSMRICSSGGRRFGRVQRS